MSWGAGAGAGAGARPGRSLGALLAVGWGRAVCSGGAEKFVGGVMGRPVGIGLLAVDLFVGESSGRSRDAPSA